MKLNKFKNYAFVIALLGSVIVLLNAFGDVFNFVVDERAITNIVTAILGVLVSLGIVVKDDKTTDDKTNQDDSTEHLDKTKDDE